MPEGDNGAAQSKRYDSDIYNTFGQLSIADVVDFARRYFLLVLVTTSTAIALGLVYALTATPLYTAYGQLLIEARVPHLANEQWTEAGLVLDHAQVESQIALLRSEHMAETVVKKLDLLDDPDFAPPAEEQPQASEPAVPADADTAETPASPAPADPAPAVAKAPPDPKRMRAAIGQVLGGLGIRRLGIAYVLEISFTAREAQKAAKLANGVMQAYIDDQINMRADAARQGSEWLEKRINALRLQMNAASLKVQEFKARRDYSIVGSRSMVRDGASQLDTPPSDGFAETLDELESTAMTYRKMFESALQAYTEAEQRQSYPVSNARIISAASPPTRKSSPKRVRALMLATIAGGLLGIGLALLQEGVNFALARRKAARAQG